MKNLSLLLLVTTLSLSLSACGSKEEEAPQAPESVKQDTSQKIQTYRVLANVPATPMVLRNANGKDLEGFDIDILNAIGEKENFSITASSHPWRNLFDTLQNNQTDILCGAISITPERQKIMDYTQSYLVSGQALLVSKKIPDIKLLTDLKGQKISAQEATFSSDFLYKDPDINPENIIQQPTYYLAISEVLLNHAAATLQDEPIALYYQKENNKDLYVVPVEGTESNYGFAVKKGNIQLLNKLNNGLNKIKADGTYDKIYRKWFDHTSSPA